MSDRTTCSSRLRRKLQRQSETRASLSSRRRGRPPRGNVTTPGLTRNGGGLCWRGARGLAARGRISYPQTAILCATRSISVSSGAAAGVLNRPGEHCREERKFRGASLTVPGRHCPDRAAVQSHPVAAVGKLVEVGQIPLAVEDLGQDRTCTLARSSISARR